MGVEIYVIIYLSVVRSFIDSSSFIALNRVTILGRVGNDPKEVGEESAFGTMVMFNVATTRVNKIKQEDGTCTYNYIIIYYNFAVFCCTVLCDVIVNPLNVIALEKKHWLLRTSGVLEKYFLVKKNKTKKTNFMKQHIQSHLNLNFLFGIHVYIPIAARELTVIPKQKNSNWLAICIFECVLL